MIDKLDSNKNLNSISLTNSDDDEFDFIHEEIQKLVDINESEEIESNNLVSSLEWCHENSVLDPYVSIQDIVLE